MKAIRDLQGANYYTVAGHEVKNIQFYAENNILEGCFVGKGWFGDNHAECAEVANMTVSFRNTEQSGIKAGGAFFIRKNATLYLDADDFESFEYLGEQEYARTSTEVYFGTYFEITMTLNGEKKRYKIMQNQSSKRVPLTSQKIKENLLSEMKDVKDDKEQVIDHLVNNPDLIELLKKLASSK
ncbi:hypothetical protein [Vibrio sp. D431a]|uniref:hypothetical protein n=1 Tax=Vibrio sp. D431a TaxID=2837388 RepID=UPI002553B9D0|nr:hypothetical protein [Vibrio sp. D431a]MDK9793351.1 hypothetical protein [Vibrio sp. D431a]